MGLDRLSPENARLECVPVGIDTRLAVTLNPPLSAGPKLASNLYPPDHLFQIAEEVIARIDELVRAGPFTPQSLEDDHLERALSALEATVFGHRFARAGVTLGDVFEALISQANPPVIAVDRQLGRLPWELLRPPGGSGRRLADLAHVCGLLDPAPGEEDAGDGLLTIEPLGGRRGARAFESSLEVRAGGDMTLAAATDEVRGLTGAGGVARATVAPPITSPATEPSFFRHFGATGYEIVHFFAHCQYDPAGFVLHVSNAHDLDHRAFVAHGAAFPVGAFHFLNVCSGAPTPGNAGRSLVEFVDSQHAAGGALASLSQVRSTSAARLAELFYRAFLPPAGNRPGRPAVEALAEARRQLWAEGSAAGYLYRMYGRPDLHMAPLDLNDSEEQAA